MLYEFTTNNSDLARVQQTKDYFKITCMYMHGLETRIELTYKILSLYMSWFRLVTRPRDKTKPSLAFEEVCTCCTKLLCVSYVQICNNSVLCTVFTLFVPIQIYLARGASVCWLVSVPMGQSLSLQRCHVAHGGL